MLVPVLEPEKKDAPKGSGSTCKDGAVFAL